MRSKLSLVTVGVLALAVAGVAVASAASSSSGAADQPVQVIRLVARQVQVTPLDFGAPGFSPGDQEVVAADLYRGGRKVGQDASVCQVVRVANNAATVQCFITLSLPDGQITTQGLAISTGAGPGTFSLAITGGTGAYRTAHGRMRVTATATDEVPLTLRLIR
jgi:hypothetical protein